MKSQQCEVAVVGASAAGLYIAMKLAREGVRVRVYEAATAIDPPRRTLIVTDKFREQMGLFANNVIVNEIHVFELFANGSQASVELDRPDLIIERADLVKVLAKEAMAEGAEIITGRRLVNLKARTSDTGRSSPSTSSSEQDGADAGTRGAIQLTFEGSNAAETFVTMSDTVIGADGAFSVVAQCAGWPRQPTVPLVQAIVELPDDMSPESTRVWFEPEDTPYFYWLIPEGPGRGGLGLIADEKPGGKNPQEALESFMEKQGLKAMEFQAAKIPLYLKWTPVHRRVGAGDVYLVGDAAGQVKVSTVGGIVTGFRGAQGVADELLHSNGTGSGQTEVGRDGPFLTSRARISADDAGSNAEIRALRRELDLHLGIRRALHDFNSADYSRLLSLLSNSAKSQLRRFHRDEAWRLMTHLVWRQPRLLSLGIKNFLLGGGFGDSVR